MRDEKYTPEVGSWLKRREVAPRDSEDTARRVATRLPFVQQRSRWWPFPVFHRRDRTSSASYAVDPQPNPIPATNGQTPTVIGRTQSMLSPAKAIVAGALVFAVGGVMLIAQPFQQQTSVPGAAIDACTTPIVYVTGRVIWGSQEPGTEVFSEGGRHDRGQVNVNTMDLDDDRLDGQATANTDWDNTGGGRSTDSIHRGTVRIENEAGAWEGSINGIGQYQTLREALSLTGSGAYEGLSATLLLVGNAGRTAPIEGAIYPTDIASCDFSAE